MKPASRRRPGASSRRVAPANPACIEAFDGSIAPASTVAQWLPRLVRNSYTRAGRRFALEGWAVKIQHQGQRRTFSLWAKTKIAAASEARTIYDTILAKGWETALRDHPRRNKKESSSTKTGVDYWKEWLLRRQYHFPASGELEKDLAVRIDHAGNGYWFPLCTTDQEVAAAKAHKIYQTVVEQGWDAACRQFPRELTVGFEWCSNPVLWTYTTVHTLVARRIRPEPVGSSRRPDSRWVFVVESDAGIRKALEWCINQQAGFHSIACGSVGSFTRAFDRYHPYLVLLNRNLAERLGFDSPGRIAPIRPGVSALTYSVVVDGDRLFVSTPGGAEGYVLKRVKPTQLLDPILDVAGPPDFPAEDVLSRVKSYFKELLRPRSDHDLSGLARLTRRENEVLVLLGKGCVDKEIARALGISAWTVHGHIKNIFKRLNVRTRTEAVVRYLEK